MRGCLSALIKIHRWNALSCACFTKQDGNCPTESSFGPAEDIFAEADFYYNRDGLNGMCVFCDGPDHDLPQRSETDRKERGKLEDRGFRVVIIRHSKDLAAQISEHPDVFGAGISKAESY